MRKQTSKKRPYPWQRRRRRTLILLALAGLLVGIPVFWRASLTRRVDRALTALNETAAAGAIEESIPAPRSSMDPQERSWAPRQDNDAAVANLGELAREFRRIKKDYYDEMVWPYVEIEDLNSENTKRSTSPEYLLERWNYLINRLPPELEAGMPRELTVEEKTLLAVRRDVVYTNYRVRHDWAEMEAYAARFGPIRLALYRAAYQDLGALPAWHGFAEFLRNEALLKAHAGDPKSASRALLAGLSLIKQARRPVRSYNSISDRSRGVLLSCDTLRQTLALTSFKGSQLHRVGQAFASLEAPGLLAEAAAREAKRYYKEFNKSRSYIERPWMAGLASMSPVFEKLPEIMGLPQRDRLAYLELSQRYASICALPYYEAKPMMHALRNEVSVMQPGHTNTTKNCMSKLMGKDNVWAYGQAYLRSAVLMIAVERYRLANGQAPAQAEALVPGYLHQLPVDPFNGGPLRYQRTATGYVISSVYDERSLTEYLPGGGRFTFEVTHTPKKRTAG